MNIHYKTGNNYTKLFENKEQFVAGKIWDEKQTLQKCFLHRAISM